MSLLDVHQIQKNQEVFIALPLFYSNVLVHVYTLYINVIIFRNMI